MYVAQPGPPRRAEKKKACLRNSSQQILTAGERRFSVRGHDGDTTPMPSALYVVFYFIQFVSDTKQRTGASVSPDMI